MFRPGALIELFNVLGIKYGAISGEGTPQYLVVDLAKADAFLRKLHLMERVTAKECSDDFAYMKRYGLCKTEAELFRKFADYRLPKRRPRSRYQFAQCGCEFIPVPHGQVMHEEEAITGSITTLTKGLDLVLSMASDRMTPFESISLIKEMMLGRLSMGPEQVRQQFEVLPIEVQIDFYRRQDIDELLAQAEHPRHQPIAVDDNPEVH